MLMSCVAWALLMLMSMSGLDFADADVLSGLDFADADFLSGLDFADADVFVWTGLC